MPKPVIQHLDTLQSELDAVTSTADLDPTVDTASRLPGVGLVKRVIAKIFGWYVRVVAMRIRDFMRSVAQALQLLADRVDRIEHHNRERAERPLDTLAEIAPVTNPRSVVDAVVECMRMAPGRTWIGDAGDGALVSALLESGCDAYGTEIRRDCVDVAVRAALEVRFDTAMHHLKLVPKKALGGAVVTGSLERLEATDQIALLDAALSALTPGGVVAVACATPQAWDASASTLARDLSPGRPFTALTWEHLMTVRGLQNVTVCSGDGLDVPRGLVADGHYVVSGVVPR